MNKIFLAGVLTGVLLMVLLGTAVYISTKKIGEIYVPHAATSSLPLAVTSTKENVPKSPSSTAKTGVGYLLQQQFAASLFDNKNSFLAWQDGGLDFNITNVLAARSHGDSPEGPIELPPQIGIAFTVENKGKSKASGVFDLKMLQDGTFSAIVHKDYIDVEPGQTVNGGAGFFAPNVSSPLEFIAGPESHIFFAITRSSDGSWIVSKNVSSTNEVFKQSLGAQPVIIKIHDLYPVDLFDNRLLMGSSHNVFVAKVTRQIGNKRKFASPETQFDAEVISNIKGSLNGTVTIDQEGGYENGAFYYVEDGAPLLQPGSTYLLSARYDGQENWYTLISFSSAWKLLSGNADLTIAQLQAVAQNDQRVQQLEAAYPHEVLLQADIAHNNALNSYQSLTEGQKAALPYYAPAPTSSATSTGM